MNHTDSHIVTALAALMGIEGRSIHHPTMGYTAFNEALVTAGLQFFNDPNWRVLSNSESDLSRDILAYHNNRPLYHGGISEFQAGSVLLPARLTGMDPRSSRHSLADRLDFVHVTPDIFTAKHYAINLPRRGCVYRVEAHGLTVNPIHMRMAQALAHRNDIPNGSIISAYGLAAWIYHTLPSLMCRRALVIAAHGG